MTSFLIYLFNFNYINNVIYTALGYRYTIFIVYLLITRDVQKN